MADIHAGMNARDALAVARDLGCEVRWIHGTGELLIAHPRRRRRVRINARRKSAPRSLTTYLRHLAGERTRP